jgi:hypothetical protein
VLTDNAGHMSHDFLLADCLRNGSVDGWQKILFQIDSDDIRCNPSLHTLLAAGDPAIYYIQTD